MPFLKLLQCQSFNHLSPAENILWCPGTRQAPAEQLKSCKPKKPFSLCVNVIAMQSNPARQGKSSEPQRHHVPGLVVATSWLPRGLASYGVDWPGAVTATFRWLHLTSVGTTNCLNTIFPWKRDLHSFHWPRHDWTPVHLPGAKSPTSKDKIIMQSGRVLSARNAMR